MKELLKLTRFWVAVAGVLAVVINHFFGIAETQTVDVLVAVMAAALGTSAGVKAGRNDAAAGANS